MTINAVEMKNISKSFGSVKANDSIDFSVKKGEIHCLLGENGAGKSTLVKILFGLYNKDQGQIKINNKPVKINNPAGAIKEKMGMIHQHFMLVDRFSIIENIIAGQEPTRTWGTSIDKKKAAVKVKEISQNFGFDLDPEALIENLSVGEQQRVEIMKALYREAEILILDEPTAVLTPQETEELFEIMESLKEDNKTIIFITHKLNETMEIADRITILRDGKKIGTVNKNDTTPQKLANMMVGREVLLDLEKSSKNPGKEIFSIKNLSYKNPVSGLELNEINISFKKGEIVGLAGVEGNGQLELEEIIAGLKAPDSGEILFNSQKITKVSTRERRNMGLAHIPSDRNKYGLVGNFSLAKNILLGSEWNPEFKNKFMIDFDYLNNYTDQILKEYDVRFSGKNSRASELSGGNQQKLIIGRELSRGAEFVLAAQPTRGVDIGAIEFIHRQLLKIREEDKAVFLISAELDELMSLSDRILVIYEGNIVARGKVEDFDQEELGLLMAGHSREER
ncbi:nucleoside ABC transporter ATP-binding protein [Halanaerobium saccharolyticum]|uniref:Nucleoside ABC transporter ATP-binding protein n=1 Tax=Halanaerobium saccharolyticum TaxID=43595 RepID=A0A4R6M280_9FIRM|nr:ABC transporter ATP-binding protein [Halanaerobium saccharolyticum]TDO95066.1 nucleoside ABC transporter ATP-binding protein [Halanaerobium saccharolyticum]